MIDEAILAQQEVVKLRKELAHAADLINVARNSGADHSDNCLSGIFTKHHKPFPPSHPIWFARPDCSCWVKQAGEFILKHYSPS